MTAEDWNRVKELFHGAIEQPRDGRTGWLAKHCADDPQLRGRVEGLLAAHEDAGAFLDHPALEGVDLDERRDGRIGAYRLVEPLGEGGFGRVWRAEQREPLRRVVALKLLKPSCSTGEILARFHAERQTLADLDHPNVARVLDAGSTAGGRPYFVMELVDGVPITEYCDARRMTARQRLNLFLPVCEAVSHAHRRGVIHRDLKPSNVLVAERDGQPLPKVIDFGIATALGHEEPQGAASLFLGTPGYLSPEQADPATGPVDARSDVYSLGALLYELLTGAPPIDRAALEGHAMGGIRRALQELDPARPSDRVLERGDDEAAAARGVAQERLCRELRGELDWILLKALSRERDDRYATPADLAADLRCHLEDRPVAARPRSRWQRLRNVVRRRRGVTAAALTAAAILLVAAITSRAWYVAAVVSRDRAMMAHMEAIHHRERAIQVQTFLTDVLAATDPRTGGDPVDVAQALDAARDRLGAGSDLDPDIELELRRTMARAYAGIGRHADAAKQLERLAELTRQQSGDDAEATLRAFADLADEQIAAGLLAESIAAGTRAATGWLHLAPASTDARHAVDRIAGVLEQLGRTAEAESWRARLNR